MKCLLFCSSFFWPTEHWQQTYIYINSLTGSDTTGDGSEGNPYNTFHKGYTVASHGYTLYLTGTFTWTDTDESGDIPTFGYNISKNIQIRGQAADETIIQSASSENVADRRIFTILQNNVTISDLTLRYGKVSSAEQDGGGICVYGDATITNCDISYNRAADGAGGGVDVRGSLYIENSTVHHNVAHYTGGWVKQILLLRCL